MSVKHFLIKMAFSMFRYAVFLLLFTHVLTFLCCFFNFLSSHFQSFWCLDPSVLIMQCSVSLRIFTWVVVVQSVDVLAEKQKVLGSSPGCRQSWLDFAQGTLEQATKLGLRGELATPPYFLSTFFACMQLGQGPAASLQLCMGHNGQEKRSRMILLVELDIIVESVAISCFLSLQLQ